MILITPELQIILNEFTKETAHKVTFYEKDRQLWFKNDSTGREYPVPVALIEGITQSTDKMEVNRVARDDFKRYVESARSNKNTH